MSDTHSRRGRSPAILLGMVVAISVGLVGLGTSRASTGSVEPSVQKSPRPADSAPAPPTLARDIRVRAILEGYGPLIDSVQYSEDDVIFSLAGGPVYFQDGRLLGEANLGRSEEYDPIFYLYSLEPLRLPPPKSPEPTYSQDLLIHLFGESEDEIRRHGVSAGFLDRKVFVNSACVGALGAVERDIRSAAEDDPAVAAWIDDIKVAYSFIDKEIAGSEGRSHHAWGMAIDLVPSSDGGKHIYWRWSRVFNRDSWDRIPLEERWSPPQAVIRAFENHGFVWGGKWSRFDTIHFEYRPEILAYNRLRAQLLP